MVEDIYQDALTKVAELCSGVIEECIDFANKNDYDEEWVLDRFQEQLSVAKRHYLNNKGKI